MEFRNAEIQVDGIVAGRLGETDTGYIFTYDPAYLALPGALPVSLTLPLRSRRYESAILFPFFDGLIPEGWLLAVAEKTWKLDARDRMGLLLSCCRECIGNVSVLPLEAP
jgi:serine/threonine-protein kinase HipA